MTNPMVERVARALFESATRHVFPDDKMAWEALPDQFKNNHRDSARAVITAMMEPLNRMKVSGANELRREAMTVTSGAPLPSDAARCWRAMISAALKD